jgi:hypothetical protein
MPIYWPGSIRCDVENRSFFGKPIYLTSWFPSLDNQVSQSAVGPLAGESNIRPESCLDLASTRVPFTALTL